MTTLAPPTYHKSCICPALSGYSQILYFGKSVLYRLANPLFPQIRVLSVGQSVISANPCSIGGPIRYFGQSVFYRWGNPLLRPIRALSVGESVISAYRALSPFKNWTREVDIFQFFAIFVVLLLSVVSTSVIHTAIVC